MVDLQSEHVQRSIAEAAAWYSLRSQERRSNKSSFGSLKDEFRSNMLKPSYALDNSATKATWAAAVTGVVQKRSVLLNQVAPDIGTGSPEDGRLLLYFPDDNLFDGAAEVSSRGFFDVNNIPPWDFWIHFSERTLVSWVPETLIDAAQMGIDVNPEECIRWADD